MIEHQPVLLQEAIEGLAIKPAGIYIDATFGRGGHSRHILKLLSTKGRLIAIDKDPDAVHYALEHFKEESRFQIYHGSYAKISEIAEESNVAGKVDGVLLDLGVSSPQLDNAERGFSFLLQGPLDMRMDTTQELDARFFVNHAEADEMARVFREYGEERFAKRIARAIVMARKEEPITNTKQFADIVKAAHPKWEKHKHPATRVFQAIRIHINQELTELHSCLKQIVEILAPGGRLAVISFHSLEDRIVKQFMRNQELGEQLPVEIPVKRDDFHTDFKRVGKAIKPNDIEIKQNIRARSAVLRIGEKKS